MGFFIHLEAAPVKETIASLDALSIDEVPKKHQAGETEVRRPQMTGSGAHDGFAEQFDRLRKAAKSLLGQKLGKNAEVHVRGEEKVESIQVFWTDD